MIGQPRFAATGDLLARQYSGSVQEVQCEKELWLSLRYQYIMFTN